MIADLLENRQICVCAGPGGVGKTSASAAIALGMAQRGAKVAVLTIDPAKRLANSLGLRELGNEERRVDPRKLGADIEMRGELWAMMLDAKRTFDDLIERNAPDAETRDAVLSNRIYQQLSNAVAGSQEYMAMEKLYELHQEGRYDLLVLDTPPTRNALDFLDAPKRLTRFIDSRSLQVFLAPSRTSLKLLGRGTGAVFSILQRITGVDLLRDLSDFFQSFGDMAQGFQERADRVSALLADDRTAFFVVTSPQRDSIDEAVFFHRRLIEGGMPFSAAIVNRMRTGVELEADPELIEREVAALVEPPLARKVARNYEDWRMLAERDELNVQRLEDELHDDPLLVVPHLDDDVHDIAGLARMNEYLFGE